MTYNPALKNLGTTSIGIAKNRVINGEMAIDQANGGASVSVNSTSEKFGVDMFVGRGTGAEGVFSLQRSTSTPPTGFGFFTRITTTTASASPAASSLYFFRTKFEGLMVRDFLAGTASAKTFSVSFWARSSLTGTFSCSISTSTSRFYVANYTINSANTWEYKTVSIVGDTTGGALAADTSGVMNLFWDVGCGTNFDTTANTWGGTEKYRTTGAVRLISTNAATLDITGVQMEIGSASTPYEYRPFAIETILCQRYYEKSYELDTAPGTDTSVSAHVQTAATQGSPDVKSSTIFFKVTKRVSPTMTTWSFSTAASGQARWVSPTGTATNRTTNTYIQYVNGFGIEQTVTNTDISAAVHWSADSRI